MPILASTVLINGSVKIGNVPNISDVDIMINILNKIGIKAIKDDKNIYISNVGNIKNELLFDEVRKIRGSYYFMGAMLSRFKSVKINYPGGCKIGDRPLDVHFKAFTDLGMIVEDYEYIYIHGNLIGDDIYLTKYSVGATINTILSSINANGITRIYNVSNEVEVDDLISFLSKVGYNIKRYIDYIEVIGMDTVICDLSFDIMPDRIEALSYIILGLTNGNIKIHNSNPNHYINVIHYLKSMGANIKIYNDYIEVKKSDIKYLDIICDKYPNIPTDINAMLIMLMLMNNGGCIKDNIFNDRFNSAFELKKLGLDIRYDDGLYVNKSLISKGSVKGQDLRGCAMLIFMGLNVKGGLKVNNCSYALRGYSSIIDKIKGINGKIKIIDK